MACTNRVTHDVCAVVQFRTQSLQMLLQYSARNRDVVTSVFYTTSEFRVV